MTREQLASLLAEVAAGQLTEAAALERLRHFPTEQLPFAQVDHHRALRQGHPEVVFCSGKTTEQVVAICERLAAASGTFLGTRASAEQAAALRLVFPALEYNVLGRTVRLAPATSPERPVGTETILVVCAGTSDLPVAEEAAVVATAFGHRVERLTDVGVAGLHRLLSAGEQLASAAVVIVVAGMEGALPSVVGGLVRAPVIAVPTSVGYGASFGGVAALLGMLNSCASGVTVVNIDNGFGAAAAASRILQGEVIMAVTIETVLGLAATAAVSAFVGWRAGRLVETSNETAPGTDPYLLPDPALDWLRRAHGALGVWLAEPAQMSDTGARFQRSLAPDPAGLTVELVEKRLSLAVEQAGSGAERLEGATLIFGTSSGYGAGILLPGDARRDVLDQATGDLLRLLEGAARKPLMQRMRRDSTGSTRESVGSVGLRLAYQLERILDAEVIIAVVEKGAVRVVGTSGRADRRLMDSFAAPGSPLYRVARGEEPSLTSIADPLGGLVEDRRARFAPAIVMRIPNDDQTVGAIAFWNSEDAQPIGPVISEVHEALSNAGPRFARALENDEQDETVLMDPLTGLRNRRGLEGAMSRHGIQHGALIYADLDKFKLLNDTHGHAAGDAALIHFARLLHAQIRTSDTAARIGGEEFALWLPGANLRVGERVAETLRVKLGTSRWEWQNASWPLSASFGVAACPESSRSQLNLAAQADAAMYRSKNGGRNRVSVAERLEAVG